MMTVRPADGSQSSGFGSATTRCCAGDADKGVDFRADTGTPVYAAAPSLVARAAPWDTYGNIVIIDHGLGVTTRYAHLAKMHVRQGDFVAAGARIGDVGATGRVTGAHLHSRSGRADDPHRAFTEPAPASEAHELTVWAS
jgi:murein DD-endopeptidase MepM/ murein hydrolase activator NlpD